MTVQIWHNPRCSKSRETLKLLEDKGIQPEIYLYLDEQPTSADIKAVLTKLAIEPRALLRSSEEAYKANNLKDTTLSDDQIIEAMVAHPKLIQRPIVLKDSQARLGRPPELVLEIL